MKTIQHGPFLGLNNRLPDTALHVKDKGDYLSVAENIDINNAGNIKLRESESLVQAMTGAHSMFENYLVRSSVLYTYTLDPYAETFAKSLTSNARVTWVREGSDIYYSNGTDSGRITAGTFYPLGLPTPAAPVCSGIAGTLYAGTYQVAVSFYNNVTGEESGISPSSNPELTNDGGLSVALPSLVAGATHVNVYLSTVNGSVPLLVGSYTGATKDIASIPATTREANVRFEAPLPAGRLFMSGQKLCSIVGKLVYVGLPYRFGYYDIVAGYLEFPDNVAIAIENQGGTYIATEKKTHWFPGDVALTQDMVRDPLPFGGVVGTEFRSPMDTTCGWFSKEGFVLADVQGLAACVTYDVLDQTAPEEGVSNVRSTNGYVRVYSCGYTLNLENKAVTQYLDYDFTSFYGDYGTKADGLYVLTGNPSGVAAKACLGKQNFGTEALKHMPATYLGVDAEEAMRLQVVTPEHDYTYDARSSGADLRIQRVDSGKGLRSSWFTLTVYNQSGSDFTLTSVSFAPVASGRRI